MKMVQAVSNPTALVDKKYCYTTNRKRHMKILPMTEMEAWRIPSLNPTTIISGNGNVFGGCCQIQSWWESMIESCFTNKDIDKRIKRQKIFTMLNQLCLANGFKSWQQKVWKQKCCLSNWKPSMCSKCANVPGGSCRCKSRGFVSSVGTIWLFVNFGSLTIMVTMCLNFFLIVLQMNSGFWCIILRLQSVLLPDVVRIFHAILVSPFLDDIFLPRDASIFPPHSPINGESNG